MSIKRDHIQHRKGLVLGLTIAEAMLLVLFALLLALGSIMVRKDTSIARLTAQLIERASQLEEAKVRTELLEAATENRPSDRFIRELVRARQIQRATQEREQQLAEREKAMEKNKVLLAALGQGDDKERVRDLAALGARIEQEVQRASPSAAKSDPFELIPSAIATADAARAAGLDGEAAKRALAGAETVMRENSTLKGRVQRLRKELASVGKGGDFPPCWVTEAGEIQYLFDIDLESDGSLKVRDAAPAARILDRKQLPIPPQLYGSVGRSGFLAMTEQLYDYEKRNECRFFVRAFDRTGPSQKKLFKDLLLTVEARFYKVLR